MLLIIVETEIPSAEPSWPQMGAHSSRIYEPSPHRPAQPNSKDSFFVPHGRRQRRKIVPVAITDDRMPVDLVDDGRRDRVLASIFFSFPEDITNIA